MYIIYVYTTCMTHVRYKNVMYVYIYIYTALWHDHPTELGLNGWWQLLILWVRGQLC